MTDASWTDRRGGRGNGYVWVMVKQSCCLPSWLDTGTGVVVFKDVLSHQPGVFYSHGKFTVVVIVLLEEV